MILERGSSMLWAYILEVSGAEDERRNQGLFQIIKELEVADEFCFFDMSGTGNRSELKELLHQIQDSDTLVVRSVIDLADTLKEMVDVLSALAEKKITLCSYEESYLCGKSYLNQVTGILSIFQDFNKKKKEQAYKQAVAEGKVGRPSKAKEVEKAVVMFKEGKVSMEQLQALTGLSKSTLYRYIKE